MIERIRRCVESYLAERGRSARGPLRYVCLDDTKGAVQGCIALVFEEGADAPVFVAKGTRKDRARLREGRILYGVEFDNLEILERSGLNRDERTTPEPLAMRDDADALVTLQSVLPGRVVKNIPGRELFSPETIEGTLGKVFAWWERLQACHGVETRTVDEAVYREEVLNPVERFRRRFVVDDRQARLLDGLFVERRTLLEARLPFMAMHGDFCTANIIENAGRFAVFDWEFPLRPHLPLFDVLHFAASTRYPFRGVKGESSHFESFKTVFWGENYFNDAVRACVERICSKYGIRDAWLPDLFVLALIRIANLKYEGLVEVYGRDPDTAPEGDASRSRKPSFWEELDGDEKDVPFACIRNGTLENLRFVAERGFPEMIAPTDPR